MRKIIFIIILLQIIAYPQGYKYYMLFQSDEPLTPITNNLIAYYTPSGLTTSGWLDKASTLHNITFSAGVTINNNALNGYKGATFDGTNGYGYTSDFSLPKPITIYIVFKDVSRTTGETVLSGKTNDTRIDQSSSALNHYGTAGGVLALSNSTLSYKVMTVVFDGASSFIQRDKLTGVSGNSGANNSMVGICLGAYRYSSPTLYANVEIAEVIVYSVAHDEATRTLVQNYLGKKYGLF